MRRILSHRWWTPLLGVAAAALAGCSWRAGTGDGQYVVGQTQSQVISGLAPQQRVLFRDDDLMIVEDAQTGRAARLRFRDGRLDTWARE
jgi:heme A synthase